MMTDKNTIASFAFARLQSTEVIVTSGTIIRASRGSQLISRHFREQGLAGIGTDKVITNLQICLVVLNLNLTKFYESLHATVLPFYCVNTLSFRAQ